MKFAILTLTVGGSEITIADAEIDLGVLDRNEHREALIELLETVPDDLIAECIDKAGTQDLCNYITPWILENNPNVQEVEDAEKVQPKEV